MCDEYTNVSNKDELTFCMRWVDNDVEVSEEFLGFYEIRNMKSNSIATDMKDMLLRYQLNLDMCRGQFYDGAIINILGQSLDVAIQILAEQPKAHYTHCHAHSTWLSVKDATKNTNILRDTMGTAEKIAILIKYLPKQENIIGSIKEQTECENNSDFQGNNLLDLTIT